jgi:peroxiredoxin
LRDETPKIHAAGAELVIVGNGTPQQASWFAEDVSLTTPVLTDPTLEIYRVLKSRRGALGVLDPRVFLRAIGALRRGFRQQGVKGDATQLGGVFVIRADGQVAFEYRSRFAGDYPPSPEYLAALN